MAHDREFQRKRKDTRMPVRDSHGEDQPAARQTEQDFDLRRARDTPSSVNGKTHRQDIPVQTEFSHLSPETPESLLEQGEAYATALDGFSEHFETPDAARTAPPIQDNVRSNFRQEASRRFLVTENATDHDTGKYAPSSEGSATPDSTDRSSQEHRYRTHQHGNKYQQRFQEAAQAEEQAAQKEKGVDSEPPKTSKLEFTADELPPQTEDKNVFYLVIDGKREDNNVYFLNGVTESDLMALAEKNNGSMSMIPQEESCNCTEKCEAGKVNTGCPVCKNDLSGCKGKEKPTETEKPAEPEKPKKETGSVGTILFILAALLAVGGIGYYVKIVRPKQQAEDDAEFEDDGYGEGFDPDEAYGEPEYLSEDDFDDKDSK